MENVPSGKHYIGTSSAYQAQYIQFSAICGLLEQFVSIIFAVPPQALHAPNRGQADVATARQAAMYLAHVVFGLSLTRVGALFERDRTTVAHACAMVEDRREDPTLDRALEVAEAALRAAVVRNATIGGRSQ